MKGLRDESGQMLVLTALAMTVLLGFMALALDVGLLFRAKRNVQTAADAAAIAGALEYNYHGTTNMVSVAKTAASNNGITDTNQVAVHNPPWSGYHTGSGYIEVVVDQPNPTVFMNMFGRSSVNVASRAVAGVVDAPTCMYVLNPHGADTFHTQGNSSITAPKCGITVDSDNANAYCDTGGSSTINAPYFRVVGGQNPKGNCKGTPSGATMQAGSAPAADPFNNMLGPNPATACNAGNTTALTSITLLSQVPPASGGVVCFQNNVTLNNLTLGSNVYLFENGVNLGGTITVNGGTFDIYQGTFDQKNATVNMTAPTTGTYNAISIMQPSSNTTGTCDPSAKLAAPCLQVQFGSSDMNLDGMIYAPTSSVYLQDQGGGTKTTTVISYNMFIKGNLTLTDNYNDAHASTTPLVTVALVE